MSFCRKLIAKVRCRVGTPPISRDEKGPRPTVLCLYGKGLKRPRCTETERTSLPAAGCYHLLRVLQIIRVSVIQAQTLTLIFASWKLDLGRDWAHTMILPLGLSVGVSICRLDNQVLVACPVSGRKVETRTEGTSGPYSTQRERPTRTRSLVCPTTRLDFLPADNGTSDARCSPSTQLGMVRQDAAVWDIHKIPARCVLRIPDVVEIESPSDSVDLRNDIWRDTMQPAPVSRNFMPATFKHRTLPSFARSRLPHPHRASH